MIIFLAFIGGCFVGANVGLIGIVLCKSTART